VVACYGLGSRLEALERALEETEITIPFDESNWFGKILTIIPSGLPDVGEIGPHLLPLGSYSVAVYRLIEGSWVKEVRTGVLMNYLTGSIVLKLGGTAIPFKGRAVINYARVMP